jgi:hypothetical protein
MVKQLRVGELTSVHREYFSYLNNEILSPIWSLIRLTEYYSISDIKNSTFLTLHTVVGLKKFLTTHCGNNEELYSFFKDTSKDLLFSLGIQVNGKIPTGSSSDYSRLDIPKNALVPHEWCILGSKVTTILTPEITLSTYKRKLDILPFPPRQVLILGSPTRNVNVSIPIGSPARDARVAPIIGTPPREFRSESIISS